MEIQLGRTDESHIIRTIEYWDIERKRYPQYEHTAVIVAEDITSLFLNVISLFNGFIPLVAIQMQAIKVGDNVSVVCSTVLDQVTLGLVDEEEVQEVTDRAYWEKKRGTVQTVKMVDKLLEVIKEFSPGLELKYNKFYIGLAENGQPNNFAIFRPQKNAMRLEVRLPKDEGMESKLNNAGLDVMDYDNKWGRYRIRLTKGEIDKNTEVLQEILSEAYRNTAR